MKMTSILFGIVGICSSLFKCNYLQNEKLFLSILFLLWNHHQSWNISKKKIIVAANVFPNLRTVKDLVKPLYKKGRFRTSFRSQHIKGSQLLVKSAWEHFDHLFRSLWGEMTWKISPLLSLEILGVFVNTSTSNDKYLVRDYENLQVPIQMQLS